MEYTATLRDKLPPGLRGVGYRRLSAKLGYLNDEQRAKIDRAFEFGARAHRGQARASGQPYISHPTAVAAIVAELRLDAESICAALLHDVIEDTPMGADQIRQEFGEDVANIVEGVSKLDQLSFTSRGEAQVESFRKMMLAMIEDIRVILVKLADRLHNMRTLNALRPDKRVRIAKETLEIFAPIANRLGINWLKVELEELGFRNAYPFRARVIDSTLRKAQGNQRQILKRISDRLRKNLRETGLQVSIQGRKKHLYSIYRKMLRKKLALNEIVDVYGLRIVVDNVDACYRTLGIIHQLYKPMPGRFKDYIAIPRLNGYQSLHTTLFGPNGIPIEFQIRTSEMHRVAQSGVAAHWNYKAADSSIVPPQLRAREWLTSIRDMQTAANSEEFMENVKVDLFPDKVYVFTPKGDILRLPRGATCVDFAYAVHTDVGNRCISAKLDRRLAPLRTPLTNGQTVQILTSRRAHPNPTWVNFVVTAKARHSIRQYLKNLRRDEAIELGRRLLVQALRTQGTSLRRISRKRMTELLHEFNLNKQIDLYEQLGLGERLAPVIAQLLTQTATAEIDNPDKPSTITIAGTEGLVVSYGRCCHPIPGDAIMGYLSSGHGVVIHRNTCGNLTQFSKQPGKWIAVEWEPDIDHDFTVELQVQMSNQPGSLAEVALQIADARSNIEQVSVNEDNDDDFAEMKFLILIQNRIHLARVLRQIRKMRNVKRVSRT
ncbi:MAG: bifunctional (p)ppGpp synthetase/guanosine-3',5'-bis(diphosphate) 3'-pyrophosphohydrolase [Gammaproteobacteria bacterium]|nr:bifunctional (p)ppGpp synthetase/guanosine-3',5'-bis(diphosphate) 3'-pyrophosphohydrolase [Gammaproteobacteria bacterium]MCP4089933.1 bifunctional (p)ppGpp synthetase/guanosine-3',5'-bis(diphosphate) 3'-pyrophosphohydrolase [Gammaproteobacteria bacterium]MCP4276264.1 bifunctional (p)ppGpp synthetase/guanosine-3',5'-bis(diphosphate) 3'-pyrophosphohydrolase [Gammaproteobacteria bacterium]MCP4831259.1 bifunctional (p)ppGpp synthetase/guanosine-3',5'-bis(diphosphate) 3'-pyrophosphohydrolase [Gamm